jgi:hypothetical protein
MVKQARGALRLGKPAGNGRGDVMSIYMVFNQLGLAGKALVLGVHAANPDTVVLCAGEPSTGNLVWSMREIPGTQLFFLKQEESGLYARFGSRDGVITLAKLSPQDRQFAIQLHDVGGGYVAIRNYEGSLAMGPRNGSREDGTRIVGIPYAANPYQQWLFGPPTAI